MNRLRKRALFSWSSGKDSAWALHQIIKQGEYEVVGLLTTTNGQFERVAMHGVRATLLRAQAEAAEIPLWEVPLPWPCSNAEYEAIMTVQIQKAAREEISHMIFGDLFLADIRAYREEKLLGSGITPVFPLWQSDTSQLARNMIEDGLVAHLVTVDPSQLDRKFAGRCFDHSLLRDLPKGVDPCGENGEFHTFVSAGPMFKKSISITLGKVVDRDGFTFCDILPANQLATTADRDDHPRWPSMIES